MEFQEYLSKVKAVVAEHGWAVQGVGSEPSVAYTVGLAKKSVPEIMLMGLPMEVAHAILNTVARQLTGGTLSLKEGVNIDGVFEGFPAQFRELTFVESDRHMPVACIVAGYTVPAWQLLWPDENGRFPGDPGVAQEFVEMQDLAELY